jgi:hypothetical protein
MSIPVVDDLVALIASLVSGNRQVSKAETSMMTAQSKQEVEAIFNALPPDLQSNEEILRTYTYLESVKPDAKDQVGLLENLLNTSLDSWLETIKKYEASDPTQAKANLVKLSGDVMKIAAASAAVDYTLGTVPTASLGPASSANTKQILAWLGVGAVVAAVAHDPVKIGLLRPYQDSLEQTFRNRRPDSGDLFLAYQQRSLSSTKIDDVEKITDVLMTQIEGENEKFYDTEISKWGYSEYFSNALKDASTKTLSFGNLMALAKQGRLNRGMAIYSLWGYGLDRKLMKIALEALDQANETANYEGFRAQIEPAYIEGAIDEISLREYWRKLHIPQDVQDLMMPRFRKKREAYLLKAAGSTTTKERDLTVSQLQQAYQNQLMDRAHAQNAILTLGYSLDEVKILLDLAEMRRKLPSAQTLKRLTLTDYEKAYKNGLITQADVLDRMKGEYALGDIDLEKKLLEIGKA